MIHIHNPVPRIYIKGRYYTIQIGGITELVMCVGRLKDGTVVCQNCSLSGFYDSMVIFPNPNDPWFKRYIELENAKL